MARITLQEASVLIGKTVFWENEFLQCKGLSAMGTFEGFYMGMNQVSKDVPKQDFIYPFVVSVPGYGHINAGNILPVDWN